MRNDAGAAEDEGCVRLACILVSFRAVPDELWTLPKLAVVGNGFPNAASPGGKLMYSLTTPYSFGVPNFTSDCCCPAQMSFAPQRAKKFSKNTITYTTSFRIPVIFPR